MLTILSVLMVVGLVLPVSAEGTSPATKEIPVKFLLNDGTGVAGAVNVTVTEGESKELSTAKLQEMADSLGLGLELIDKENGITLEYSHPFAIVAVKKSEVAAPATKEIPVKFMLTGSNVAGVVNVTVTEGETKELSPVDLQNMLDSLGLGLELRNKEVGITLEYANPYAMVFVKESETPAPASKNVPIKFMTGGSTPAGVIDVTVGKDETKTLRAVDLQVLADSLNLGLELLDKEGSVEIKFDTPEVRVYCKKIETEAPANKTIPVKFMTDGTTVVGTKYVTVAEGEEGVLSAAALQVLADSLGLELLDKEQSLTYTYNSSEIRVLVKKSETPAPANKNIPVKFMTDGTTVVGTKFVTVAEGEEVTLRPADLQVLLDSISLELGYKLELVNNDQNTVVQYNNSEVRVIVKKVETPAPANKEIPIKFMTDGTTVAGTRYVTVAEGEEGVLTATALQVLADSLGLELLDKEQSVVYTYNTPEIRVFVKKAENPAPANKNITIKFMTDGTTVAGTANVTVAEGETLTLRAIDLQVLADSLDLGLELVNNEQIVTIDFNTSEVRVLVKKIEAPAPGHKNLPIKFMTDGSTVVGTRYFTVVEGEETELKASALKVLADSLAEELGYELELLNNEQSVYINYNTSEVRVLVKKVEAEPTPTPTPTPAPTPAAKPQASNSGSSSTYIVNTSTK